MQCSLNNHRSLEKPAQSPFKHTTQQNTASKKKKMLNYLTIAHQKRETEEFTTNSTRPQYYCK